MRRILLLTAAALLVSFSSSLSAQDTSDRAAMAVPSDPRELATGQITKPATPKSSEAAVSLVDLARRNIGLYESTDLAFTMKISFSSTGPVSYIGPGTMEEIRTGRGNERWSATVGSYSIVRIFHDGAAYDKATPGPIPLRIQMLRAALFWPFGNALQRDAVRTRSAVWNGRPTTCVLRSIPTNMEPMPPAGRYWREREYCIDRQTGCCRYIQKRPAFTACTTTATHTSSTRSRFPGESPFTRLEQKCWRRVSIALKIRMRRRPIYSSQPPICLPAAPCCKGPCTSSGTHRRIVGFLWKVRSRKSNRSSSTPVLGMTVRSWNQKHCKFMIQRFRNWPWIV